MHYGTHYMNNFSCADIETDSTLRHIHPLCDPEIAENDIALINLSSSIAPSDNVHMAKLFFAPDDLMQELMNKFLNGA